MTDPRATFRPLTAAGLAALAFAAYANTLGNGFVYDDLAQILGNPWLTSWSFLPKILANHPGGFNPDFLPLYYRPWMNLSFLATRQVLGPEAWGFHLVNVLWHVIAVVLAYAAATEVFRRLDAGLPSWCPAAAAAIFAVHPAGGEAVAWNCGVTDLTVTVFGLASVVAYLRGKALLAALAFASALLAKETAVVFPAFLAVVEVVSPNRQRGFLRRLVPLGAVLAAYLPLRLWALGGLAPGREAFPTSGAPWLVTVGELFARYLAKLLWPHPLNALSGIEPVPSMASARAGLGLLAVVAFAALLVAARRRPAIVAALALVALPLLPVLLVRPAGAAIFADRYLYLPALGFGLALGALAGRASPVVRIALVPLLLALGTVTVARNAVWKDGVTLWTDTVAKSPSSAVAWEFLCQAHAVAGRYADALSSCARAVELDAGRLDARINLGNALAVAGRFDEASRRFLEALRRAPHSADAWKGLGYAYARAGRSLEAVEAYRAALRERPDFPEAHNDLGLLLDDLGEKAEAQAHLREAVRLRPDVTLYADNLAKLLTPGPAPGSSSPRP